MDRRAATHGARRNLSLIHCLTQGVQSITAPGTPLVHGLALSGVLSNSTLR